LDFLSRLCRDCKENWSTAVIYLSAHHLQQEPITSWRPVEVTETRRSRFVGLRNLGATCYMNATVQQLFMMPELRNALLTAEVPVDQRNEQGMLFQVRGVMCLPPRADFFGC
jgi:ubiquitin carboxyl-terminal hydrolase 34